MYSVLCLAVCMRYTAMYIGVTVSDVAIIVFGTAFPRRKGHPVSLIGPWSCYQELVKLC